MRKATLRMACLLTGRNYQLVQECSEASIKRTLRYFGAMLIVMILWGVVGFLFGQRYLHFSIAQASIMAVVMAFVVAQIERYIILGPLNWKTGLVRFLLGIVMALLGALIIDQILFREDIEKEKIETIHEEVNRILPKRTLELRHQIVQLDSAIAQKEREIADLQADIQRRPMITTYKTKTVYEIDSAGNRVPRKIITDGVPMPNPNIGRLKALQRQDSVLRAQKTWKEEKLLSTREDLERELLAKVGFLDELETLKRILFKSAVAATAWGIIFGFFLFLELLVVLGKLWDDNDDYDHLVELQKQIRIKQQEALHTPQALSIKPTEQ